MKMKITESQLRFVIREELLEVLNINEAQQLDEDWKKNLMAVMLAAGVASGVANKVIDNYSQQSTESSQQVNQPQISISDAISRRANDNQVSAAVGKGNETKAVNAFVKIKKQSYGVGSEADQKVAQSIMKATPQDFKAALDTGK
jgi:hypothetical protein